MDKVQSLAMCYMPAKRDACQRCQSATNDRRYDIGSHYQRLAVFEQQSRLDSKCAVGGKAPAQTGTQQQTHVGMKLKRRADCADSKTQYERADDIY